MAVPAPDLAALRLLGDRIKPLAGVDQRTIPVAAPLASLLPHGGLPRGATVITAGIAAVSLAFALVGPVTVAGSWVAVVGVGDLGLVAAAEAGVELERLLLVVDPGPQAWATTVAGLLDAVEIVLVGAPPRLSVSGQRRLTARARDRGSVLIQVGGLTDGWAHAPDLVLTGTEATWDGLGTGHGHLRSRRLSVAVTGRRGADRPRRGEIMLPGPDGTIASVVPVPSSAPARTAPPVEPAVWRDVG